MASRKMMPAIFKTIFFFLIVLRWIDYKIKKDMI